MTTTIKKISDEEIEITQVEEMKHIVRKSDLLKRKAAIEAQLKEFD